MSNASPAAAGLAASSLAAAGFVASSGVVVASSDNAVAATEFGASCRVVADAADRADIHADTERQKVVMAQSHIEDSVVVVEVESSYS